MTNYADKEEIFLEKPAFCRHDLMERVYVAVILRPKLEESIKIIKNFAKGVENPDDHEMFFASAKVVGFSWGGSKENEEEQDNPIYVLELEKVLFCNSEFYKRFKAGDLESFNWSWVDILGETYEKYLAPEETFVLS